MNDIPRRRSHFTCSKLRIHRSGDQLLPYTSCVQVTSSLPERGAESLIALAVKHGKQTPTDAAIIKSCLRKVERTQLI